MSGLVNITALAEANGLPRDKAARMLKAAGVTRDLYRLYDEDAATAALQRHLDPARVAGNHATGMGGGAENSHMDDFAAARSATERARTRKIEIDNDAKMGKLISSAKVTAAGIDFAATMRNGLLAFGAKLAPRLVGKTEAEIGAAIDAEMRHALEALADVDNYLMGVFE